MTIDFVIFGKTPEHCEVILQAVKDAIEQSDGAACGTSSHVWKPKEN